MPVSKLYRLQLAVITFCVLCFFSACTPLHGRLGKVRSWAYQLQHADPEQLARSPYNLIVMDYSADGSGKRAFSRQTIARIRNTGKIVLAYLSIGEAETYRFYWKKNWTKNTLPSFILPRDQGWENNYVVRYWHPRWQEIIWRGSNSYLDRILRAGFDGVYLDRVDSYRFWKKRGKGDAAVKMAALVRSIAGRVRRKGGLVFVQNAPELAGRPGYLAAVHGIGQECAFYTPQGTPTSTQTRAFYRKYLGMFRKAGKLVLTVDYVQSAAKRRRVFTLARSQGFIPYCTRRKLDRLEPYRP